MSALRGTDRVGIVINVSLANTRSTNMAIRRYYSRYNAYYGAKAQEDRERRRAREDNSGIAKLKRIVPRVVAPWEGQQCCDVCLAVEVQIGRVPAGQAAYAASAIFMGASTCSRTCWRASSRMRALKSDQARNWCSWATISTAARESGVVERLDDQCRASPRLSWAAEEAMLAFLEGW
jgi:hypothetical protein